MTQHKNVYVAMIDAPDTAAICDLEIVGVYDTLEEAVDALRPRHAAMYEDNKDEGYPCDEIKTDQWEANSGEYRGIATICDVTFFIEKV